jgi:hypothetical protein
MLHWGVFWRAGQPCAWPLAILQTWPSRRRLIGFRLQALATLGEGLQALLALAAKIAPECRPPNDYREHVEALSRRYFEAATGTRLYEARYDMARYVAQYGGAHSRYYRHQGFARTGVLERFPLLWSMQVATDARPFDRDSSGECFGLRSLSLEDFLRIEFNSLGWLAARAALATVQSGEPSVSVVASACRSLSILRTPEPDAALARYSSEHDPVWPALTVTSQAQARYPIEARSKIQPSIQTRELRR